jgi:threonine synthase
VIIRYVCVTCGRRYETEKLIYRCSTCSEVREKAGFQKGNLVVEFAPPSQGEPGAAVDPLSLLPFPIGGLSRFPVGNTPLVQPSTLHEVTGFHNLFLKVDSLNPSGSLKDRASLLVAEQAKRLDETRIVLASTGNAGASMACAGAAYGLRVILFVPASAPRAKLVQSLLYGALVVPVQGTYDDAFSLSVQYTDRFGGVNRNTGYNPFTVEGKKTVSIEMYNQLGGQVPDFVYVPTGDGVIYSGACKGFADLVKAGLTERMPVMIAVQAEGSNAIARSWREGREITLESASTIADSLSVASPASGQLALDSLRKTGGRAVEVSDEEISRGQAELCREAGVFVEPSSAAAWAGFLKDRANLDPGSTTVVLLTGTGFKDIGAAEKLATLPSACPADLKSATALLKRVYGIGNG